MVVSKGREKSQGAVVSASTLRARFPPTVWHPPHLRIQDHNARTRSAGAEASMAQASTPPLAPEPANPSASAIQPSAGTGAGPSAPEVEHTTSRMFEVSLEGLGASAQDIEALRRIRALIAGKSVAAQQEQETRPSSSQAQPSQQQDVVPPHAL
jgi:phage-related tail fiber protein